MYLSTPTRACNRVHTTKIRTCNLLVVFQKPYTNPTDDMPLCSTAWGLNRMNFARKKLYLRRVKIYEQIHKLICDILDDLNENSPSNPWNQLLLNAADLPNIYKITNHPPKQIMVASLFIPLVTVKTLWHIALPTIPRTCRSDTPGGISKLSMRIPCNLSISRKLSLRLFHSSQCPPLAARVLVRQGHILNIWAGLPPSTLATTLALSTL